MACCVSFEPVPASTRQRLFAFATATRITCSRSSCDSVGDSPVVPIATIPLIPAAICVSTSCSKAERSIPPSRNGVTNAVNAPRNISSKPQIYTDETEMRKAVSVKGFSDLWKFVFICDWLNLNRSFKYKFGGSRQRDVAKASINFVESNLQFVSATRNYADRCSGIFDSRKDKR